MRTSPHRLRHTQVVILGDITTCIVPIVTLHYSVCVHTIHYMLMNYLIQRCPLSSRLKYRLYPTTSTPVVTLAILYVCSDGHRSFFPRSAIPIPIIYLLSYAILFPIPILNSLPDSFPIPIPILSFLPDPDPDIIYILN